MQYIFFPLAESHVGPWRDARWRERGTISTPFENDDAETLPPLFGRVVEDGFFEQRLMRGSAQPQRPA